MPARIKSWTTVAAWWLLPVVIGVLVVQAYHPLWRPHLQVDVVTFQLRAVYFLDHASWAGLGHNEYQPGALWFFVLLGPLSAAAHNFDAFLTATILVNAALLVGHFYLFARYGPRHAPLVLLVLALASGPILLHRFELIVSLIVLVAWFRFRFLDTSGGAFLLGIATAIKVYPVVLLPVILVAAARRRFGSAIEAGLAFAGGLAIPVGLYLATGGTIAALREALSFHQSKPVGLEGVVGVSVMLVQWLLGLPLRITPGFGVHGFTSDVPLLTNSVLDLVWLVPTGLVFLAIVWLSSRRGLANPVYALVLLMVFVIFSKVLNPQYLWWFLVFLPWVAASWWSPARWVLVVAIAAASLLLTQLIYPINYSEYLAWFNQPGQSPWLFIASVVRNVLLLLLLGLTLPEIYRRARVRRRAPAATTAQAA